MTSPPANFDHDQLLQMMRRMLRIRRFEEKLGVLFKRGRLPGFIHLYIGAESVAVGACSALVEADRITSTHELEKRVLVDEDDIRAAVIKTVGATAKV